MAKVQEKIKARKLRRRGYSIKSIAEKVGVSKGSASTWCADIALTEKQRDILTKSQIESGKKGRFIGAEMNRQKKLKKIELYKKEGKKEVGRMSKRDFLMVGLGLFWGEGVKSDKSNLGFVNSDPKAVYFMYIWFRKVLGVKKEDLLPRIFINEIHRSRKKDLLFFWARLLELPIEQLGNPVFLKMKNKKRYENHDSYFGVLNLSVRKSSELKYRIWGLLDAVKDNCK